MSTILERVAKVLELHHPEHYRVNKNGYATLTSEVEAECTICGECQHVIEHDGEWSSGTYLGHEGAWPCDTYQILSGLKS